MQRVLIIGATSAIAEAVARIYASEGARLYLLARNTHRLDAMATDLAIRGAVDVQHAQFDVTDDTAIDGTVDAAWTALGGVDVVLMAHGTLPDQLACDSSRDVAVREFSTNATATIALLIPIAARMEASGRGTIAVISSVAGDRGRASNYLYGAAKAAVSTYLSGLRQRLNRKGINVLTIKPGFVDTPMTASFRKGALWATPGQVAQGIVNAITKRKSVAYTPAFWALIMYVIRSIPEFVFRRLKL